MEKNLFTPIIAGTGNRPTMHLSDKDYAKITRGMGYKGIVTNLDDGKRYRVYGRPCNLPTCFCDATARLI